MAAFAKAAYSASAYGAFRPTYPKKLYDVILAYHHARRGRCVDLGCGTGGLTSIRPVHIRIISRMESFRATHTDAEIVQDKLR